MRLMFVTSNFISGGCERHAISIMNRLGERGHECHAVYIKPGADMVGDIRLLEGGTITGLEAERYLDWRALRELAALARRVEPDAIVAANPYALMYSSLALRLARSRARLVTTYHTTVLSGAKERLMMVGYRPLFWAADCTIFVSSAQARYSAQRGVLSRRNEVIHNGVDVERYQACDAAARAAVRSRFGFAEGDYVLGLIAVLRPEKNPVQLVEAVARLRAAGCPARALMIGDGDMRGAVEARARELGVAGDIAITGFQLDVRPYVAACDTVVLCSTSVETFSLAALEAMAMGKPVVLSELGGAAEMVFPGWNGYLFPPGDGEALVRHLAVLAERSVSIPMGRNARRVVESLFSEGKMVDRYEQVLTEICRPRTRPGGLWTAGGRVNNPGV